jgi:hypothetical protein
VARAVRTGSPRGMPCFTADLVSDDQILDLQAYVITLPETGFLGGPEDRPAVGAGSQGGSPAGVAPPGGGLSSPCSSPSTTP